MKKIAGACLFVLLDAHGVALVRIER